MLKSLKITSCQAENADMTCRSIATYLGKKLGLPTEFIADIPWQERERLFDLGKIQINWICGLPYVWKADQVDPQIELLAAPVMQAVRYQGQSVYFSDVVVHRDSPFQRFADLQGASWAYNEPQSHSGYNITCYQLAKQELTSAYFGKIVEAGAHQLALRLVSSRQIDASAIDSTVLELELQRYPELADQVRVIDTWGPSPIPPWLILKSVPHQLRQRVRQLFLTMHQDPEGQAILAAGQLARFAPVEDRDYDPIRQMAQIAAPVKL
jgi:phosphonate transport system substrate-binding protein